MASVRATKAPEFDLTFHYNAEPDPDSDPASKIISDPQPALKLLPSCHTPQYSNIWQNLSYGRRAYVKWSAYLVGELFPKFGVPLT